MTDNILNSSFSASAHAERFRFTHKSPDSSSLEYDIREVRLGFTITFFVTGAAVVYVLHQLLG